MDGYIDDIASVESARGCLRCEMQEERLPGCPYWCAKWSLNAPEADRTWRDREIIEAHKQVRGQR